MNQLSGPNAPWTKYAEPEPATLSEADLDVMMIVRLMRRRLRLILSVTVVLSLLALPFIMHVEPLYRAEARFLLQPALSLSPTETETVINPVDEVERLRARSVAETVVADFALADRPEFNTELVPEGAIAHALAVIKAFVTGGPDAASSTKPDTQARVLDEFYERLTVWNQSDSILQLSFASQDPQLAADVPNAMIEAYANGRTIQRDARLAETLTLLNARIEDQRERVAKADAEVRAFQEAEKASGTDGDLVALQNRLTLLNGQLSDLQNRRNDLRATIATVDAALNDNGPAPLSETPVLADLRKSLQVQTSELRRLTGMFGDAYGGVQAQRARVQEIEASIDRELTGWAASMQSQLTHLDEEEVSLTATRGAVQDQISRLSLAGLQLATLSRRASAQSELLDTYDQQRRDYETLGAQPPLSVEVLTPATRPIWPEGRSHSLMLALAIAAALLVGLTIAGLKELSDRTVRSTQQLTSESRLLPLGMLPLSKWRGAAQRHAPTDSRLLVALRGVLLGMTNAHGGTLPQCMMITSVQPGDGARFVARALASEIMASGHDVLLVDTLPRRGLLRLRPGRAAPTGLAEYLRKEARLADLIRRDSPNGLRVLERGRGTLLPLRDSAPIDGILDHAKILGLTVIFVCPPVLGSAATQHIAAAARSVLLVLRWGRTPLGHVALASEKLRNGRSERVMTVLNGVDPKGHAQYSFRDAAAFPEWSEADAW